MTRIEFFELFIKVRNVDDVPDTFYLDRFEICEGGFCTHCGVRDECNLMSENERPYLDNEELNEMRTKYPEQFI